MSKYRRPRTKREPANTPVLFSIRMNLDALHTADVLSKLQEKSRAEIIEQALLLLASQELKKGGAVCSTPSDPTIRNLATETWTEMPWLRRLKMHLAGANLVGFKESLFWQSLLDDPSYWQTASSPFSDQLKHLYGEKILSIGLPNIPLFEKAWAEAQSSL